MPGTTSAWGIDVGVTALKAIKLRKEGAEVIAEAFDVVEHERFLTEPDVDKDETVRHTLAKFLERNQLRREAVFVGVPGSSTFARFVKLPPVEPKKVPEIVRFEAMQQIPFPLEQVNWDYQTFSSPDTPEVEVGIFAMKKELVAQVMANFQSSAMIVEGVQMSPLALYNAAVYDDMTEGKGTILVDIGAEHTDLIFIDGTRIWLRTINIGGNNFTDAISKSFKVAFGKAEQLKKTAATSKYQKQIYQAMRPVFSDLVSEIQRSKGYYDSSHRDAKLERMVAMGNPFKLPNLQKYIQQEMKMEVIRFENFRKAQVDPKIAAGLSEQILTLGGAFGLAVQGLDLATINTNLLPTDIARKMLWYKKRPMFAAAAAAVVVGACVYGYATFHDKSAFADSEQSQQARTNTSVVTEARGAANAFQSNPDSTYEGYMQGVKQVLSLFDDRNLWPQIYKNIQSTVPQKQMSPEQYQAAVRSGARNLQKVLIIKSVNSVYTKDLSAANGATAGVATPAPADATPVPGAAASLVGKRGFRVDINGYTPYAPPTETQGLTNRLIEDYRDALVATAPEKDAKGADTTTRFYITLDPATPAGFSMRPYGTSTGTSGAPAVQSTQGAPFWAAYSGDWVEPQAAAGAGGMGTGGPTLTGPIDPDIRRTNGRGGAAPNMNDYWSFTIPLIVVVRDAAAAAPPPPPMQQ